MKKSLLLISFIFLIANGLLAQVNITGQVKSATGETLPGVSVIVKGTKQATLTDANGKYTLANVPADSTLKFSLMGMVNEEIAIGGRTSIDVDMKDDVKTMDEVVIVGYGEVKKAHLLGSISNISAKEIEDLPTGNLGASLSGKLAGVSVSGGLSRPGSSATITVRNPSSWAKDPSQGTNPLYVIDDVVYPTDTGLDAFNELDPSEIESISVIKDASAAVFGSRSANGVVLVKTKRGKVGRAKISYNGSYGIETAKLPKMMNAYEYATYMNDYNYTNNTAKSSTDIYSDDELEYYKTHSWNWLKEAWKTSNVYRQTINASGGSDNATYFAGVTYYNQDGNYTNINYDKWTFRSSTDIKISDRFKLGFGLSGNYNKNHHFLAKLGGTSSERDWQSLVDTPPDTPPYVNGYAVANNASSANVSDNYHFFEIANSNNYIEDKNTRINININASYEIPFIKGLKINGQYARMFSSEWEEEFGTYITLYKFNMTGDHGHIYSTPSTALQVKNSDRLLYSPSTGDNYQLNGGLSYNHKFGLHEINLMSTVEQTETSSKTLTAYKDQIYAGADPDLGLYAAYGTMDGSTSATEGGTLSVAGRANYNYAGKYLAEFSYRFDSSTKFAPANYWAFFPSMSAGWVVSEESFFNKNSSLINYLKIRGTAGFLGTDNAKAWLWKQRYSISTSGATFGGNTAARNAGLKLESQPNADITWDNNDKFNLGIDSRLLNDRLSATVEGYFNHGYNLLTSRTSSTSLTVGGVMPDENYGVRNDWGMEFSLGWQDKIGDFDYHISTNFGWNNDVTIVKDQASGVAGNWNDIIGKSSSTGVSGYQYTGMLRTQADVDKILATNPNYTIFGLAPAPGMLNYKDIRGAKDASGRYTGPDGKIDESDLGYISPAPRGIQGFSLELGAGWKGLKASATLNCSWGTQNTIDASAMKHATTLVNRPAFWADHWTPENTNAKYPNPYYSTTYEVNSSFWFVNSFTLNVRTITVSYTLPKPVISRLKLDAFKIYMSAVNPFALYNPYDYRSSIAGDYHTYPNLSSYSIGLSLSL